METLQPLAQFNYSDKYNGAINKTLQGHCKDVTHHPQNRNIQLDSHADFVCDKKEKYWTQQLLSYKEKVISN